MDKYYLFINLFKVIMNVCKDNELNIDLHVDYKSFVFSFQNLVLFPTSSLTDHHVLPLRSHHHVGRRLGRSQLHRGP